MSEWRRGAVGLNPEGHAEMWIQRYFSSLSVSLDSTEGKACALCHAAEMGHIDAMKLLLENGVDVNRPPFKETNPRRNHNVNAPWEGSFDYPPTPNDRGRRNNALHCAVQNNHLEAVRILLNYGANIETLGSNGGTCLHTACQYSDTSIVAQLLESGGDINATDDSHRTPLWLAVQHSKLESVKLLIASGAALNVADLAGQTPLHIATSDNQDGLALAKHLVEAGASMNMMDKEGQTPLLTAIGHQQGATAVMLINAETNAVAEPQLPLNKQPPSRSEALISAAEHGLVDVVQCLIEKGCEVNASDDSGNTALHKAVQIGYLEIAEHLLKAGALVDVKNKDHTAPLHYAAGGSSLSFLQLLLEHHADINIRNEFGMTPLCLTIMRLGRRNDDPSGKFRSVFKYLLQQGANPNIPDLNLQSPLIKAITLNLHYFAIALLQHGCDVDNSIVTNIYRKLTQASGPKEISKELLNTLECVYCTGAHFQKVLPQIQNVSQGFHEYFTTYEMNPLTLKQLSRICIRKMLGWKKMGGIDDLPIPVSLKDYLWMKEFSTLG